MIYHNKQTGDLATDGFYAYHQFQKVIKLTINEGAKGSGNHQEDFRKLQVSARDGNCTEDDWNLLLTRTPDRVKDLETFKKHSVRLSFGNEKVAKDNYECLTKLKQLIATVNAKHNNTTASKLPEDDIGSLMPQLLISKAAKVMLTRNLWTDAGLCNGAIGIVKHIIYKHGDLPPSLPVAVIVQFDENYIGPSVCKEIPRCVPITPVINPSDTLGFAYEREQLPIKLAGQLPFTSRKGLLCQKHGLI